MTDIICPKCGHPADEHHVGVCVVRRDPPLRTATGTLYVCGCEETEASIYRHALIEMQTRERQALDAHAHSFSALAAVSLLTDLGGEVDDYSEVPKAVERIIAERDVLRAELLKSVESERLALRNNEGLRAERDEALRYGRSADSVIADLRDQLAAFHLFPIDVAPFLTPEGNENG